MPVITLLVINDRTLGAPSALPHRRFPVADPYLIATVELYHASLTSRNREFEIFTNYP